jgi:hypothetical protein
LWIRIRDPVLFYPRIWDPGYVFSGFQIQSYFWEFSNNFLG